MVSGHIIHTMSVLQVRLVVHDSTADCRYMVLPARPAWTRDWGEEELVRAITRDALIGVAVPERPRETGGE